MFKIRLHFFKNIVANEICYQAWEMFSQNRDLASFCQKKNCYLVPKFFLLIYSFIHSLLIYKSFFIFNFIKLSKCDIFQLNLLLFQCNLLNIFIDIIHVNITPMYKFIRVILIVNFNPSNFIHIFNFFSSRIFFELVNSFVNYHNL